MSGHAEVEFRLPPLTPGRPLTPNELYAALLEVAGYVPVPPSMLTGAA
jgi:hypothetical protein